MAIGKTTARYVDKLSRLKILEEELDSVCNDLSSILNYMDEINSTIDTDFVEYSIFALFNRLLEKERILKILSDRWGNESERYLNENMEWDILEEKDSLDYVLTQESLHSFQNLKI